MNNLPVVKNVIHEVSIPELSAKAIKYRAFNVDEEKALLTAYEQNEPSALINTIAELVNACTFGKLDLSTTPTHVVDFLYLMMHSKAKGGIMPANYVCNNQILQEDQTFKKCDGAFTLKLDLAMAKIFYPEGYKEKQIVMLDGETGIRLRVPNFEDFRKIKLDSSLIDITDAFIFSCVDSVFTPTSVLSPGVDFQAQEFKEWIGKMDSDVTEKLSEFFQELPYLGLEVSVTCPLCRKKEDIKLKGLEDFFV